MKNVYLLLLLLLNILFSFSQNLDSLINISKHKKSDSLVQILNEISWEYRNSNADSALYYATKALDISILIKNQKEIASSYNSIAASYEATGELDSAEIYHQRSLSIKKKINDTIGIADSYNNLGIIFDTRGNYSKALENYFIALEIYENYSKDISKIPMVLVNIGIVYKKQKEYKKVLNYYQEALEIYKKNNNKVGQVITTGNIGSVLLNLGDYTSSIKHSLEAKQMYAELGYTRYVPYMQVNMAIAKDSLKQFQEARQDYLASIAAFKKDQNLYELTNAKVGLSQNYMHDGLFNKAYQHLKEALVIIREKDFKEIEVKALKQLAEIDAATGNYKKAFNNFKAYAIGKDSLFEKEKIKVVFELETKYKTEKKEKQILIQRADLAEQGLTIQKRNYQLVSLLGLALILGLIGYIFYNQQKLKNKQLQKENELKDALAKIETQNRLQEQRLRISRDLHDNIGAQLTFIISSLDNLKYGFSIEDQKLTNKLESISSFTTETIYELRDTIWAMNKNEISFEDLKTRITNFIDKANLVETNTEFEFKCADNIDKEKTFTSVDGMNIYRIIQESVNNAIKYAESKIISVNISEVNKSLSIKIEDEGKGFDVSSTELGNGINNIKKRAYELNAEIEINSTPNKGTSIILLKPIYT